MISGGAMRMLESFGALMMRPSLERGGGDRGRDRLGEADADEEAGAAHLVDERRVDRA